jgi:hypothetical protein
MIDLERTSTPATPPGKRRRLPVTRSGITHKFSIAAFDGSVTANTYDDGSPGELFINDIGKENSTRAASWPCRHRHLTGVAVRRAPEGPGPQARAHETSNPKAPPSTHKFPKPNPSATTSGAGSPAVLQR